MRRRIDELGPNASSYLFVILGTGLFLLHQEAARWIHATPPQLPIVGPLWAPFAIPPEIFIYGLVYGALNALPAMALVLIYRMNRIVNFAQGELGAFAAIFAAELIIFLHWNYWLAVLVALSAAAVSGALVELVVVRTFFNSPRLILTVATIGVAQILAALQLITPFLFEAHVNPISHIFPAPFQFNYRMGVMNFDGGSVSAIIVAPLVGLGLWFFLRTMLGSAIRAAGEDAQRARALGVPAKKLSTLVWSGAAVVSAVASMLNAHVTGFAFGNLPGPGFFMRSLAPATVGRFDSLRLTFLAALALGMVEQGVYFETTKDGPVEVVLFVIIMVISLVQVRVGNRYVYYEGDR